MITETGAFDSIDLVALHPNGSVTGPALPPGITAAQLDVPRLRDGHQQTGHTSSLLAYSVIPTPISTVTGYLPVLVVTRQIHDPGQRIPLFPPGRRHRDWPWPPWSPPPWPAGSPDPWWPRSTPPAESPRVTSTPPCQVPRQDPEFAQLADSINAMGANLVRARDQERQFLLSVSHELRTPLTSIRGYADAVVDGATDDPSAAAAVISTEARRMERLVQDLLDLARLDADRFSLRPAAGRLRAGGPRGGGRLPSPGRPTRPRAGRPRSGSAVPVWVSADPDRLGQVVANLVENASSFAAHPGDGGRGQRRGQARGMGDR